MRKFTGLLAVSILFFALSIPAYIYYCEFFWDNYFEYETTLPEDIYYAFDVIDNKENAQITLKNYKDFTWKREIVTTDHGNWHIQFIDFLNDSLVSINSSSEYLDDYNYSFPVFRTLLFNKKKMENNYTEMFDEVNMEIVYIADGSYFMHKKGQEFKRIKVELINQKLVVYSPWL